MVLKMGITTARNMSSYLWNFNELPIVASSWLFFFIIYSLYISWQRILAELGIYVSELHTVSLFRAEIISTLNTEVINLYMFVIPTTLNGFETPKIKHVTPFPCKPQSDWTHVWPAMHSTVFVFVWRHNKQCGPELASKLRHRPSVTTMAC